MMTAIFTAIFTAIGAIATMCMCYIAWIGLIRGPIESSRIEKLKILKIIANFDFTTGSSITPAWAEALHHSTSIFNDTEISRLKSQLLAEIVTWSNLTQLSNKQINIINVVNSHRKLVIGMATILGIKDTNSLFEVYTPQGIITRETKIDEALSSITKIDAALSSMNDICIRLQSTTQVTE